MSKIPKDQIKEQKSKIKRKSEDKFAYRTVIISCVLSIIFYAISLLFNVGVISIFTNINILFNMLDVLIKVGTILLLFLFMMISVGNYKELTGKPLNWKELLLLIVLSLGQTLLNLWVFAFTFIGLLVIIIYLYIVQEL